jgi:hypothetical protein
MIRHTARPFDNKVMVSGAGFSGKENEVLLNCTPLQYLEGMNAYNNGALMQNAFPFLSPDEREFLISGTTAEEWEAMFGEEEK